MWDIPADAYCITTNGFVKKNGEAVMGAGCAKEAAKRWPDLPRILGNNIKSAGNLVNLLWKDEAILVAFPVKHNWFEKADIELIERSAAQLMILTEVAGWQKVLLPRPGCGNGRLEWADVRKVLEPILDERVYVVSKTLWEQTSQ
jgi:hypothetical protein